LPWDISRYKNDSRVYNWVFVYLSLKSWFSVESSLTEEVKSAYQLVPLFLGGLLSLVHPLLKLDEIQVHWLVSQSYTVAILDQHDMHGLTEF